MAVGLPESTRWRRQRWRSIVAFAFTLWDLGPQRDELTAAMQRLIDEPTLREVARMTEGKYFHASTAETLRTVHQNLGSRA